MASILAITGSPAPYSRSSLLAELAATRLLERGFEVDQLPVRELPAEALLQLNHQHPVIQRSLARVGSRHRGHRCHTGLQSRLQRPAQGVSRSAAAGLAQRQGCPAGRNLRDPGPRAGVGLRAEAGPVRPWRPPCAGRRLRARPTGVLVAANRSATGSGAREPDRRRTGTTCRHRAPTRQSTFSDCRFVLPLLRPRSRAGAMLGLIVLTRCA